MPKRELIVRNLTKRFTTAAGDLAAVDDVSFDVRETEFFTMLGPSGCGKTTTLRMIAGLETVSAGTIVFDGRDYTTVPAQQRNIGMVFQSYALFPHLTIFENVAYGLRLRKLAAAEARPRVERILDLLQLAPLAARLPASLSGGQQQRVSIARALVYAPGMLLLDEPLANLDAKLRVLMREEIRRIQRELGIMSLYVTHDQEEAMSVSDRLAVFDRGRLMQIGRPEDVYTTPRSLFVADFIGKANFFHARLIESDASAARVALASGSDVTLCRIVPLRGSEVERFIDGCDAIVMVRPERLILDATGGDIPCRVGRIQFLGGFTRYTVDAAGAAGPVAIDAPHPVAGIGEGTPASLRFAAADAILYLRDAP